MSCPVPAQPAMRFAFKRIHLKDNVHASFHSVTVAFCASDRMRGAVDGRQKTILAGFRSIPYGGNSAACRALQASMKPVQPASLCSKPFLRLSPQAMHGAASAAVATR